VRRRLDLPRPARLYIVGMVVAGLVAVAIRVPDVGNWNQKDLFAFLGLVLANILIEQFMVRIPLKTETLNIALEDALWIGALMLARPSTLTLAIAVGGTVGQCLHRWRLHKIAFNIAQFLVAITFAEWIFHSMSLPPATHAVTWAGAALAMFACFVFNVTSIAMVISLAESRSFLSVLLPPLPLNLVHWAGNIAIGILGTIVYLEKPLALPLLVVPAALSYLAYRAWVHGMRERDRMRNLYEAGRALFAPLTAQQDLRPFVALVQQMLDAQAVEVVVLADGRVEVHDTDGTYSLTSAVLDDGTRRPPEAYVRARPGLSSHLAVIGARGEVRGVLASYREQPFSDSEKALLDTLASQVFIRFENLRLFSETVEQRTQLSDIIAHTSDGIFVVAPDQRVMSWNPAMEQMTGVSSGDAIGASLSDVVRTPDGDGFTMADGSRRKGATGDVPLVREDGSKRWLRYTRNPIQDRDGELTAFVVVARDITADLESEQLKADFVATVSHELRTPLTPLKGFLSALLQGTVEDSREAREEYYRIMLNQTSRLERLITDLLEVSSLESGKPVMDLRSVEVTSVIAEHVSESSTTDGGRVTFSSPDGPVLVHADPFRLGQVIANLVSNALKYSPDGSPVEVTVIRDGEQAIISVRDQGEGIPLSEQARVFDRFHRVESGMTRRTGGTGLGLYIAKRLVEAMAGRLWLTSRPGEGSTFSFSLPLAEVGSLYTTAASAVQGGSIAEGPDEAASAKTPMVVPDVEDRPIALP
jgi:PAS domain S-box-containing protein